MASTILPASGCPLCIAGITRISCNTFVLHWSSVASRIIPLSSITYVIGQNVLERRGTRKEWLVLNLLVRTISL